MPFNPNPLWDGTPEKFWQALQKHRAEKVSVSTDPLLDEILDLATKMQKVNQVYYRYFFHPDGKRKHPCAIDSSDDMDSWGEVAGIIQKG